MHRGGCRAPYHAVFVAAELWRLAKKSEVTVPTPVCGKDLLLITSGNRPIQPIFAISLKEGQKNNAHIAWSTMRGGPYMPTPILYGPHFDTCSNSGVLACYEAATGKEVYKQRMSTSDTASPARYEDFGCPCSTDRGMIGQNARGV
jgi:outer membrane protein assembly factor BamB